MVKKIMIVDDDPGVIFTVKHGLEGLDEDYEIFNAETEVHPIQRKG